MSSRKIEFGISLRRSLIAYLSIVLGLSVLDYSNALAEDCVAEPDDSVFGGDEGWVAVSNSGYLAVAKTGIVYLYAPDSSLNSTMHFSSHCRGIGVSDSGEVTVQYGVGGVHPVYVSRFSADGTVLIDQLQIYSGICSALGLGSDAEGNSVTAYSLQGEEVEDPDSIYVLPIDADGTVGGAILIESSPYIGGRTNSSLSVASNGNYIITWGRYYYCGNGEHDLQLWAHRSDGGTAMVASTGCFSDAGDADRSGPYLENYDQFCSINSNGDWVVTYQTFGRNIGAVINGYQFDEIIPLRDAHMDEYGVPPFFVRYTGSALDGDGNFHLVCETHRVGYEESCWTALVSRSGTVRCGPNQIGGWNGNYHPRIAANESGRCVTVYTRGSSGIHRRENSPAPKTVDLIDPYQYVLANGVDLNVPTVWDFYPGGAVGVCADGVGRLVLRIPAGPNVVSASVQIAAEDGTDEDIGELRDLAGSGGGHSLELENVDSRSFVYCEYRAPIDYVRVGSLEYDRSTVERVVLLNVEIEYEDSMVSEIESEILVRRPPVVLLHGAWGSETSFTPEFVDVLAENGTRHVQIQSYRATNNAEFDANINVPQSGIQAVSSAMRSSGFVSTQADVVAHSMGGCITRNYANNPLYYNRPENFNQGDIHRFVPVNSPMWGSNLANLIVDMDDACGSPDNILSCGLFYTLGLFVGKDVEAFTGGAEFDLMENGPTVSSFGETPMLSHAAYSTWSGSSTSLLLLLLPGLYKTVTGNYVSGVFCNPGGNDGIVPLESQMAGIGLSAGTDLGDYKHSAVIKVPEAAAKIVLILDTPSEDTDLWGHFPAHIDFSSACGLVAMEKTGDAVRLQKSDEISIVFPPPDYVVSRGELVEIQLASRELSADESIYVVGDGLLASVADPLETISWEVPNYVFGSVSLVAAIGGSDGITDIGSTVQWVVDDSAVLETLEVYPDYVSLRGVGDALRMSSIGHYSDGGVRYFRESDSVGYVADNANVVIVDGGGTVIGVGRGNSNVTAHFDGVVSGLVHAVVETDVNVQPFDIVSPTIQLASAGSDTFSLGEVVYLDILVSDNVGVASQSHENGPYLVPTGSEGEYEIVVSAVDYADNQASETFAYVVEALGEAYQYCESWGSLGSLDGQFDLPYGVTVASNGHVFVTGAGNHRVQEFDAHGVHINTWGSFGSGQGQFNQPLGIQIDSAGFVFIADRFNNRIQKFTSGGTFVSAWGQEGSGPGEFDWPFHIGIDANDNVYVTDYRNYRIQKFTNNGEFLLAWGSPGNLEGEFNHPLGIVADGDSVVYVTDNINNRVQKFDTNGVFLSSWGTPGAALGQFDLPVSICLGGDGTVFVTEEGNERVQEFRGDGTFLSAFGSFGQEQGQFDGIRGVAFFNGRTYATDAYNSRVQVFQLQCDASNPPAYAGEWGVPGQMDGEFDLPYGIAGHSTDQIYVTEAGNHRVQEFDADGNHINTWGSFGSGQGQFNQPLGIQIDSAGFVFIADRFNNRIQKFTSGGTFVSAWGQEGSGPGEFDWPFHIGIDANDNVYVTDYRNYRIQKFTNNGEFLLAWGSPGNLEGEFNHPLGIVADGDSVVYVTDNINNRVQKFDTNGVFLSSWGTPGAALGQFDLPVSICLGGDGTVFVTEEGNERVQEFRGDGTFVSAWGGEGSGPGQFNGVRGITYRSGRVYVVDMNNSRIQYFEDAVVSGVELDGPNAHVVPLIVHSCSPNPFNAKTTIRYAIDFRSVISVKIFDVAGRLVKGFEPAMKNPGTHTVEWAGKDKAGRLVPSGVYIYQIGAGSNRVMGKIALLK